MDNLRKYGFRLFLIIFVAISGGVEATNTVYLPGYDPIAVSLGGAGMAYYHGTGGVMHNPATLGLRKDGYQLDLGAIFLSANINAEFTPVGAKSSAHERVLLPSIGLLRKQGRVGYGVMLFPQAGLSTLYSEKRFLAAGTQEEPFSALGSVKLSVPLTFDVTEKLTIGASISGIRAAIDLDLPLTGGQFADFVTEFGGSQTFGMASGSFVDATEQAVSAGVFNPGEPLQTARLKFADSNPFNGEAAGFGYGGHIGLVYEITERFSIGLTYQSQLNFSDLKTDNAKLELVANVDDAILDGSYVPGVQGVPAGTYTSQKVIVKGDISVKDFALPAQYGVGFTYKLTDQLMLAIDVKQVDWSSVFKSLQLTFDADSGQVDPLATDVAGTQVDLELFQDWKDQTIFSIGMQYAVNPALSVRAGVNLAKNPVPDHFLNPLFPAIVKNHYALGMTYRLNENHQLHGTLVYAPESKDTNPLTGIEVSHRQLNTHLMYSYSF